MRRTQVPRRWAATSVPVASWAAGIARRSVALAAAMGAPPGPEHPLWLPAFSRLPALLHAVSADLAAAAPAPAPGTPWAAPYLHLSPVRGGGAAAREVALEGAVLNGAGWNEEDGGLQRLGRREDLLPRPALTLYASLRRVAPPAPSAVAAPTPMASDAPSPRAADAAAAPPPVYRCALLSDAGDTVWWVDCPVSEGARAGARRRTAARRALALSNTKYQIPNMSQIYGGTPQVWPPRGGRRRSTGRRYSARR